MAGLYAPESFYETTLAAAITATASTIPVTVAPTITAGYLVIEASTANREIIKYTGVSTTNLTGCVRGLATYGSNDSAGTGKAHAAGTDIANKDVHYYFAQYYDFLNGTSATGTNTMRIGDGNTISASDRYWYVQTSSLSAFWGLNSSGQMVVSEDGVTSYVISAGGSGIAAGNGISITAGTAAVSYLSSGGIQLSGSKVKVGYDGGSLKSTSAGELYLDKSYANSWTGLNDFTDISIDGTQISATAAEINLLDNATGKVSSVVNGGDATGMHTHKYFMDSFNLSGAYTYACSTAGFYPQHIKLTGTSGTATAGYVSIGVARSSSTDANQQSCVYASNNNSYSKSDGKIAYIAGRGVTISAFNTNGIILNAGSANMQGYFIIEFFG